MNSLPHIGLSDVQAVYSGAEGDLWQLLMGEQIHIGGLASSLDLARRADIKPGSTGVDLCCCNGAGMRFLTRFCNVRHMIGVDATAKVVARGQQHCQSEGLGERIRFVLADVCASGLPDASADFIWGEDAWCYVVDKATLIAEAGRIVVSGGTIAFTDWVEGPTALSAAEAERFLKFMKFPSLQTLSGYAVALAHQGCQVLTAEETHRFAPCIDLYLNMVTMQLQYDALKTIGFDQDLLGVIAQEMLFVQQLAHAKKVVQGMFIARKR